LISVLLLAGSGVAFAMSELRLTEATRTNYIISLASDASLPEKNAASELAAYLQKITGAEFQIVSPAQTANRPTIAVGPGAAKAIIPKLVIDKVKLGDDGIVIKTAYPHLVLTGAIGSRRGTLYAVYEFLEREAGVRWWTHTEEYIPSKHDLTIKQLNIRYVPQFRYREVYSWSMVHHVVSHWRLDDSDAGVKDWDKVRFAVRQRNNGHGTGIPASLGGSLMPLGFCHTFYPFLPPDKYFKVHPEWYSEIDGIRVDDGGQLCMTNDDMLLELSRNVLTEIRKQPGLGMVSLTQNDNGVQCQCAKCKTLDDTEGSPSGSLLYGVNKVAEMVEKEFPDFYVLTLAYQYSMKPPKNIRPRKNVVMQVAFDNRSFFQPLKSEQNKQMMDGLKGWSSIGANVMIWDYYLNYNGPLAPHPNVHTIGPDIRTYRDNRAVGVFLEDETVAISYFTALKTYLAAHLLWDPSQNANAIMDVFLKGYYGKAAPELRQVINIFEKAAGNVTLRMWPGSADASWASLDDMNHITQLFTEAEAAVADNQVLLARVKRARIPIDHQWLYNYQNYRVKGDAPGNKFLGPVDPEKAGADFAVSVLTEFAEMTPCDFTEFAKSRMDKTYLEALTKRATQSNK
jgi:hypothetical protein